MPEHTDTTKEKILVYIRAEKQKTLHRRQVCINDIASVYCKYSRYEGQIKGIIVDKIRGKKSVISVMKIIAQQRYSVIKNWCRIKIISTHNQSQII